MYMYKISRRDFLALAGTVSLFALFGCNNNTEKKRHEMITYIALQKYELLTCENENMLVKYVPQAQFFDVIKLDNINNSIEEVNIFHKDLFDYEKNLTNFLKEYNVIYRDSAQQVFIDLYGTKDFYTIEEVTAVIKQKNIKKIK